MLLPSVVAETVDSTLYDRTYYIERSSINKSTGNVFLFGGPGLSVVGFAMSGGGNSDGLSGMDFTGPALFLGGLAWALISTPFYVSSTQNLIRVMEFSAGTIRMQERSWLFQGFYSRLSLYD